MPVILVSQRSTSEFCELAPEGQNWPWRPGGCLLQERDLKCSDSSSQLFTPLTGSARDVRGIGESLNLPRLLSTAPC